ncbi:GDSL-type esterase/lipase family protein [Parabacteroides chongii]|uniref:GDSL-type esterase/lipase family protein n=1 Tax=Parabacteroides chongii TaxID=2685834 RepID=UPI00240D4376|nr:GDSL-type esterase/lipase family protein [Parabacteroides chongii]WFE86242.1 GDSL-type esterase/lipase family protein [Parabacteroides chongii]
MKKTLLLLCLLLCTTAYAQKKIKVACVGNSVTYGAGIDNREVNSYPAQLQRMLGEDYEVMNFGKSGATLLNKGHRPYCEQEEYKAALDFAGDLVVIHLGLNDTDPRNWPNYRDNFVADYLSLIESFRKVNPACKIWICRMTPISHRHPRFKSGTRDWYWQEQATIEEIANLGNTGLIDLQAGLYNRPDLLPDALHPTAEGAGILAKMICRELTGNYGGLQMPVTYSDNMVLQREKPLSVSGTANTGEKVTVQIAGQKKETVTASNGKWSVTLDPMQAGGPYELTIEASLPTEKKNKKKTQTSRKLTYKDVLVGEVWLCSGQSNMAFRVDELVDSQRKELTGYAGKQPQIRLFNMEPRWFTNAVEWDEAVMDSLNRLQYYHDTQWTVCNEQTADRFSAVAFSFGQMLSDSLQVPVGLILNAVGGSGTEAWIDRKTLEFDFTDILYNWTENDFIQDWVRGRAALNIKKSTNKQQRHPYEPCYLYETGIEPLQQYPIRGIIWYQGESNAQNMETHERLFPLLVNSWRENWQEELPFYYVQLSSIDRPSWTWFRDSQRRMMQEIPNCGMAVSSDRGDSLNVHPRYKREIGERLARWALNRTYGHRLTPSGPLFRSVEFKDDAAYITFDYAEGLHTSDGQPIRTFEIAEYDGLFVPAEAEIVDGKVKVRNDKIARPQLVRYGWQPFTRANLVNGDELPASTFRSKE